jgi:hypothetical protein
MTTNTELKRLAEEFSCGTGLELEFDNGCYYDKSGQVQFSQHNLRFHISIQPEHAIEAWQAIERFLKKKGDAMTD